MKTSMKEDKIMKYSKLEDDDITFQFEKVFSRINFVREKSIPDNIFRKACSLC